jgi:hypothetical protein
MNVVPLFFFFFFSFLIFLPEFRIYEHIIYWSLTNGSIFMNGKLYYNFFVFFFVLQISNFEDKYGSIWKDFSPNYVAARRKSTTGRRSSIFKKMSVPLLEQDVETAELSVNFVPRVDSPELTRGPDDLSANNSLSVIANSSAVMPNLTPQQIDKSTSSNTTMNNINIETPKSFSGN